MIVPSRPEETRRLEEFDLAISVAGAYGTKPHAEALAKEKAAYETAIPSVMVMEEMPKARPMYVLKRGQYDQPDKSRALELGTPSCMPGLPAGRGTP